MGITDFAGEAESRVERFQKKLKKIKSKEEQRHLEEVMLKPAPLLPYTGQKSTKRNPLEDRTVIIVFPRKKDMELFKKYMKLSRPPMSVLNIQDFIKILKFYDKHKTRASKKKAKGGAK